ncbi:MULTISPECIES: glycosyl hydrolase family 18 protein [unclassified Photobacterium]|uniref:glycosyl hydrolase family 18 protein n=1 Tax=unclassified Photobacterium TaxID=2628852 RepID=UPI001EDD8A8F|nr:MULTISPECIES: glycosyl hydrolase family 18 protein [unclassified Photobacterium]MCG3865187.1 chitinase [Photobacterium sp. Ph6]MCG3876686.1 chitinase [Photobacterium sp. Ph5]
MFIKIKKSWIENISISLILLSFSINTYALSMHNKNVIGYLPQWEAAKGVEAGYSIKGEATQLNINLEIYTIINFSFFGVAKDGSLHSGDFRNSELYLESTVQEPAPLFNTSNSWDLPILWGELEYLNYFPFNEVSDADNFANVKAQGFVPQGHGWLHLPSGITGNMPIPLKKQGGALGLLDLAHHKGVKVMASIGGWSMSKHFPEMAANPDKKARFLADIDKLIAFGFDGIDINWEYPGFGGMNFNGSTDDFANFEQLMEDIRVHIGPDKLLSAAFSASTSKLTGYNWNRLTKSIDYFNMMTYDLDGGWSTVAGHNAPLYSYPEQTNESLNLDTLRGWLFERGVAPEKINLGVAFYGRGVKTTAAKAYVGAPTAKTRMEFDIDGPAMSAADTYHWAAHDGQPNYNAIVKAIGWEHKWDANAQVPYAIKDQYFLSYDNPKSITEKAEYVVNHDLGGVAVWQASGDIQCHGQFISYGDRLKQCTQLSSPLAETIDHVFSNTGKNTAPELIVPSQQSIESLQTLQFTVTATDAENNPLTFTAINAQIVTAENGRAVVSFIAPKTTTDITTSVTIIVSDGQVETIKSVPIDVKGKKEPPLNEELWDRNTVYYAGDVVSFNSVYYIAQWWTKGEQPDLSPVWVVDNRYDTSEIPQWKPISVYHGGDKVNYQGDIYQAKWWTQGDKPDHKYSPWSLIQ